jgi:hypothetical protein
MRYAAENCCENPDHCTNRGSNLNMVLSEGLSVLETWIDDQAFLKRIRNFHVVNPNDIITPDGLTKKDTRAFKMYWRSGPVHMTTVGYEKLGKGIVEEATNAVFKRADAPASTTNIQRPPITRGRARGRGSVDLSTRRQGWITNSDTVAHRSYHDNNSSTSQNRGQRGQRGHWRGRGHFSRSKSFFGNKFTPYGKK